VQTLQETHHSDAKRILSLDGGGLRVFFTLEVLERVEGLVRERLGRPEAVLADHFDLIAGTSTGAILGAFLAWGLSISQIKARYQAMAVKVFRPYRNPLQWVRNRYDAAALSDLLRDFFVEQSPQGPRVKPRWVPRCCGPFFWPCCAMLPPVLLGRCVAIRP
jgi:predicted acylesterase/phospholipase RssA